MAEREAILGKAACLQGCCRTVEANTPLRVASCPSPEEMRLKGEFAALANRIRHACRKRFAALRCSSLRQHHLLNPFL